MAHPNEDLVREVFAANRRGDIDALRNQYFADGICLHYPGRSPWPATTTA
jgi:ketosteroid isomerase-like protein